MNNVTVKWDDKTTHHKNVSDGTPLHYNEPKTLTDEEIDEVLFLSGYELVAQNEYDVTVRMPLSDWQEMLKKASEK